MKGNEVRSAFLDYFAQRGHRLVPSSSLVPRSDPTLLFTNAGMVQFKDVFTGAERREYARAASSQKCLRVSGKHNDLENVGRTARHHTFFEMLGNFSFGEYFKREAIAFAWELLVERFGLRGDRMWATIYEEDDQAEELWRSVVGMPADRIVRRGKKDNFWAMGETGPCGPCSELVYDQGDHIPGGPPGSPEEEGDRFLELWNLVFMQFERSPDGRMSPLPRPSIDTGMGLERVAAVLQGVESNYHTDLLLPLIRFAEDLSGQEYAALRTGGLGGPKDVSFRVIADHSRAISFLVADGVLPSNEGRGYVLRRIARRAMRHGRMLGVEEPFLYKAAGVVADMMGGAYPELKGSLNYIARVILNEEERFAHTLSQAQPRMDEVCSTIVLGDLKPPPGVLYIPGQKVIPGEIVFELYDTYGYPLDLAFETATYHGLEIDERGFQAAMERQRQRARAHWKGSGEEAVSTTYRLVLEEWKKQVSERKPFIGYETTHAEAHVLALLRDEKPVERAGPGEEAEVVLDRTPFYGEAGGQVGDTGKLLGEGLVVEVVDTQKPLPELYVHRCRVAEGELREGAGVSAHVDGERREAIRLNHTATHLLQYALRQVLGDHVKQAGSLVAPERLRFDFTHFSPMTPRERERVEDLVNRRIRENAPVGAEVMPLEEALSSGATALFGERYGEVVRVVSVGDYSKELCGGTHARAAGDIGLFRLVHEGGVAAGVRRVEALTGEGALAHGRREAATLREVGDLTKSPPFQEAERVRRLLEQVRSLEREVRELKGRLARGESGEASYRVERVGDLVVVVDELREGLGIEQLRERAEFLMRKEKASATFVASVSGGKVDFVASVAPQVAGRIHAGRLVKEVAAIVGGSGGGRADFAQGGGRDVGKAGAAVNSISDIIRRAIGDGA